MTAVMASMVLSASMTTCTLPPAAQPASAALSAVTAACNCGTQGAPGSATTRMLVASVRTVLTSATTCCEEQPTVGAVVTPISARDRIRLRIFFMVRLLAYILRLQNGDGQSVLNLVRLTVLDERRLTAPR